MAKETEQGVTIKLCQKAGEYTHDSYVCSQAFYLRQRSAMLFVHFACVDLGHGADSIIQVGSDSLSCFYIYKFVTTNTLNCRHTLAFILSRTLERTERQLTGLQLDLSVGLPFLSTGVTTPTFHNSGNFPSVIEALMILVR